MEEKHTDAASVHLYQDGEKTTGELPIPAPQHLPGQDICTQIEVSWDVNSPQGEQFAICLEQDLLYQLEQGV